MAFDGLIDAQWPSRELLLEIWREACQHIEIEPCLARIALRVAPHVPLGQLILFRVDPGHHLLAWVAASPALDGPGGIGPREIVPADLKRLLQWIRAGSPARRRPHQALPTVLAALPVPDAGRELWIAPLTHMEATFGILVVAARGNEVLSNRHEELLEAIREPLAVALTNDRRVHELAALREAAEADRRSLLRRLGRSEIAEKIVGEGTGLAHVMRRVAQVSGSDAPVLLLGETGTGKEVIARAVHLQSERREGPFIRVNCGAIPSELVDSQLFGHEKGAFTGAAERRRGWFERADGGTLFLDEIGELPGEAQVRFLRVLQDACIERVGGVDSIHVDVRVIAATHRDLASMVQANTFREDLWYRIAVFPILLPPLRDRMGDIPALAEHFAHRAAVRFGLPEVKPTEDQIELLRGYAWPGNIRELGTVIDRAAILGEGRSLEIATALGLSFHGGASPRNSDDSAETVPASLGTLDEVAKWHIESTLRRTRGRIEGPEGTAAMLGINPHTLRARMRKLGIQWSQFRR